MVGLSVAWLWRNGLAHGHAASLYESGQTSLQCSTVQQDMSFTLPAAQTDIGTEPVDQPLLPSAGVRSPEGHNIAEQELDDPRLLGTHFDGLNWENASASSIAVAQSIRAGGLRPGSNAPR
jgi:hypothetical protein